MLDVERGAFLDLWPRFVPVGALLVSVRDLKDAASSSALPNWRPIRSGHAPSFLSRRWIPMEGQD